MKKFSTLNLVKELLKRNPALLVDLVKMKALLKE